MVYLEWSLYCFKCLISVVVLRVEILMRKLFGGEEVNFGLR